MVSQPTGWGCETSTLRVALFLWETFTLFSSNSPAKVKFLCVAVSFSNLVTFITCSAYLVQADLNVQHSLCLAKINKSATKNYLVLWLTTTTIWSDVTNYWLQKKPRHPTWQHAQIVLLRWQCTDFVYAEHTLSTWIASHICHLILRQEIFSFMLVITGNGYFKIHLFSQTVRIFWQSWFTN